MNNKNVLITGGSSGIGAELAKIFAKEGYSLILVAREKEKLETFGKELENDFKVKVDTIAINLSDMNAPQTILDHVHAKSIEVDILVNDAGIGVYGEFSEIPLANHLSLLSLNIGALTSLTHLLLPDIIKRKGKILNVGSLAGFLPGPLMSTYYASKAYVVSFSQALQNELRDKGVSASVLCPGATRTDFDKKQGMEGMKHFGSSSGLMSAKEVAQIGYNGLMKGKTIIVPGFNNKLLLFIMRFGSRNLQTKLSRKVVENWK